MKKTIVTIPLISQVVFRETETIFYIAGWLEVLVTEIELTCSHL